MKKTYYLLPVLAFILTGCTQKFNYQYLATHPKILEQVLANCAKMPVLQSSENNKCIDAENARQEVAGYLEEVRVSMEGFGQKILKTETKLASLKAADKKNPSEKSAKAVQVQKDYLARLVAITKYIGE